MRSNLDSGCTRYFDSNKITSVTRKAERTLFVLTVNGPEAYSLDCFVPRNDSRSATIWQVLVVICHIVPVGYCEHFLRSNLDSGCTRYFDSNKITSVTRKAERTLFVLTVKAP